jgi:hypothetical protein
LYQHLSRENWAKHNYAVPYMVLPKSCGDMGYGHIEIASRLGRGGLDGKAVRDRAYYI